MAKGKIPLRRNQIRLCLIHNMLIAIKLSAVSVEIRIILRILVGFKGKPKCYRCGKFGHIQKDCTMNVNQSANYVEKDSFGLGNLRLLESPNSPLEFEFPRLFLGGNGVSYRPQIYYRTAYLYLHFSEMTDLGTENLAFLTHQNRPSHSLSCYFSSDQTRWSVPLSLTLPLRPLNSSSRPRGESLLNSLTQSLNQALRSSLHSYPRVNSEPHPVLGPRKAQVENARSVCNEQRKPKPMYLSLGKTRDKMGTTRDKMGTAREDERVGANFMGVKWVAGREVLRSRSWGWG